MFSSRTILGTSTAPPAESRCSRSLIMLLLSDLFSPSGESLLQMSGTGGAAPPTAVLGLDVGGPWHRGAFQKKTHLLMGSVKPGNRTRTPLRLPSLVAAAGGTRRRSSVTRFSLSEPSLFSPSDDVMLERFCSHHSSVLQKPPSFNNSSTVLVCENHLSSGSREQQQIHNRPAFVHFSQSIQPCVRPRPLRRHSHNPVLNSELLHGDLRRSAAQRRNSSCSQGEALSVVGRTCVLSCSQRPAAPAAPATPAVPAARAYIHVFLPSEVEGKEADNESVDEGFMDELESRISSLKLQQGSSQTVSNQDQT